MKTAVKVILVLVVIVALIVGGLFLYTYIKKNNTQNEIEDNYSNITTGEQLGKYLSYHTGMLKEISIDEDLEMTSSSGYFNRYYIGTTESNPIAGVTIKGNGHTITIKGDDGSLGPAAEGFFDQLVNCNISNLNIVYNPALIYTESQGFGGIARKITNTTLTNVNVTYKRGLKYQCKSGVNAGGLVGTATNSTISDCNIVGNVELTGQTIGGMVGVASETTIINNCSMQGNFNATGYCCGAMVGTIGENSKISDCTFSGSVKGDVNQYAFSNDAHNGYFGGIAGQCYGEANKCHLLLNNFDVKLNFERSMSTSKTGNFGLVSGFIKGYIHDSYVDIADGATVNMIDESDHMFFSCTLYKGIVGGRLVSPGKIKNVYVDATEWNNHGDTNMSDDNEMSSGFGSSTSNNITNVFFVDNDVYNMYTTNISMEMTHVKDEPVEDNEGIVVARREAWTMSDDFLESNNTFVIEYVRYYTDGKWQYEKGAFNICGKDYTASPTQNVLFDDAGKITNYIFEDEQYSWEINIVLDLGGNSTVDVKRNLKNIEMDSRISNVEKYSDISFETSDDIISDDVNVWTTAQNGKPIFK